MYVGEEKFKLHTHIVIKNMYMCINKIDNIEYVHRSIHVYK